NRALPGVLGDAGERIIPGNRSVVYLGDGEADVPGVRPGVGRAVGRAVVRYRVVEARGPVEVGGRGELDVRPVDASRPAAGVRHGDQAQRLAALVGRAGAVVAQKRRDRDDSRARVLGDARQWVVGRSRGVVYLGDGEGDVGGGARRGAHPVGGA